MKIKSDIADTIKETNELQESFASVNHKLMTMQDSDPYLIPRLYEYKTALETH